MVAGNGRGTAGCFITRAYSPAVNAGRGRQSRVYPGSATSCPQPSLEAREFVIDPDAQNMIIEAHAARPIDKRPRRRAEIGGMPEIGVEVFHFYCERVKARGLDT